MGESWSLLCVFARFYSIAITMGKAAGNLDE